MPAAEVITSYHELWHVQASLRMSNSDLPARPIFHHTRDAIEAHLSVVFAAPAVARYLQNVTGISIKKIVHTLRPRQHVTVHIAG
ncbi:MAG: IS1634 family transposase, partial [Micrococcales bacterium]